MSSVGPPVRCISSSPSSCISSGRLFRFNCFWRSIACRRSCSLRASRSEAILLLFLFFTKKWKPMPARNTRNAVPETIRVKRLAASASGLSSVPLPFFPSVFSVFLPLPPLVLFASTVVFLSFESVVVILLSVSVVVFLSGLLVFTGWPKAAVRTSSLAAVC